VKGKETTRSDFKGTNTNWKTQKEGNIRIRGPKSRATDGQELRQYHCAHQYDYRATRGDQKRVSMTGKTISWPYHDRTKPLPNWSILLKNRADLKLVYLAKDEWSGSHGKPNGETELGRARLSKPREARALQRVQRRKQSGRETVHRFPLSDRYSRKSVYILIISVR